ncbi:MAG: hypothetical protein F3743_09905 [Nitrospinae bacterium]|nr:hypothetical protein [Nitrospinota bacterium]
MFSRKFLIKSISLFLLAFLLVSFKTPAVWAGGPVSIDARVDISQPTLGDIITYSITVTHDPDIVLQTPGYAIPEGLEKLENGKKSSREVKKQFEQEFWLKLRVDKIGEIKFSPIPVEFEAPDPDNQIVRGKIMAPEVVVQVQSLLQLEGNAKDIKDIKPIAKISAPWAHYIWKILAILGLLALGYFLWKKRERNKPAVKTESTVMLTPEQKALKELQELKKQEMMKLGRIQEHFFELSEIFRRYLENRFHFPAQEWTTEEIITYLKNFSELNDNQKLKAKTILIESDKVKFAKVKADKDPIDPVINFIKEATPKISAPGSE